MLLKIHMLPKRQAKISMEIIIIHRGNQMRQTLKKAMDSIQSLSSNLKIKIIIQEISPL